MTGFIDLHVRSYADGAAPEHHAFAQLVLPLSGTLDLEVSGRGSHLSPARAAFIEPGMRHSQESATANSSLILDFDPACLSPQQHEKLRLRPFPVISRATARLIEYLALQRAAGQADATFRLWLPLLLDGLLDQPGATDTRFAAMQARVEAEPGEAWTTQAMAELAGMSVSRLHDRFRELEGTTPHSWLEQIRLRRVCHWLATSAVPLAELALRSGYADQSALTRAMRRVMDTTPAAYRRKIRENA